MGFTPLEGKLRIMVLVVFGLFAHVHQHDDFMTLLLEVFKQSHFQIYIFTFCNRFNCKYMIYLYFMLCNQTLTYV